MFRQAVHVLGIFQAANERRTDPIAPEEFYNDLVNNESNLQLHYDEWYNVQCQLEDPNQAYVDETFSLINYPWILDAASKSDVLSLDSRNRMT